VSDDEATTRVVTPQPGFQESFLSSKADIVIGGGSAGCGKSFAALMEALRWVHVPNFFAVYFRRTTVQIRNPGGLLDASRKLYPEAGGVLRADVMEWSWETDARVKLAHLEHENTVEEWQGTEVPLFVFDELPHFTERMFFYMLSRNRSTCGVKPYMMATANPTDPDHWVAKLIAWWIDQETGLPIPERAGKLRWFVRINDELVWGDTPEDVLSKCPSAKVQNVKSLTFIPGKLHENKELLRIDPGYEGNLQAMTRVERARLLDGNWKVRKSSGSYFRSSDVRILDTAPTDFDAITRRWDLAASEPTEAYADPDWTCGVKMGRRRNGRFVVLHVELARKRANEVREMIKRVADNDGPECSVGITQDPAQAGKEQAESYVLDLAGHDVYVEKETGDKETRAEPCAAQWQHQNIDVVRGPWNDAFFAQLEAFPTKGVHDDAVDALSGAFRKLLVRPGMWDLLRSEAGQEG
jgi:predicted phage terminase large subunit-like protein